MDERSLIARGTVVVLGDERAGVVGEIRDAIQGQAGIDRRRVLRNRQHRALNELDPCHVVVVRRHRAVGTVGRGQRVVHGHAPRDPDLAAAVHRGGPRLGRQRIGTGGELVERVRPDDIAAARENDVELRVLDLPQDLVVIESKQRTGGAKEVDPCIECPRTHPDADALLPDRQIDRVKVVEPPRVQVVAVTRRERGVDGLSECIGREIGARIQRRRVVQDIGDARYGSVNGDASHEGTQTRRRRGDAVDIGRRRGRIEQCGAAGGDAPRHVHALRWLPARAEGHEAERKGKRRASRRGLAITGNARDRCRLRAAPGAVAAGSDSRQRSSEDDGNEPTKQPHGASSLFGHDAVEYLAVSDHSELLTGHTLLHRGIRLEVARQLCQGIELDAEGRHARTLVRELPPDRDPVGRAVFPAPHGEREQPDTPRDPGNADSGHRP